MKKTILMLLLAAMSTGAMAKWTWYGTAADGETTHYIDLTTIRKNEDTVKVWVMYDYKRPRELPGVKFQSTKNQYENDCANERIRHLAVTFYAGRSGDGEPVYSTVAENPKWEPVVPQTAMQRMWKIACGKQ